MPLYEYKCEKCGNVFEVIQKFSEPPLQVHHNCGGAVERLLSPPALVFKGSGWYVTDYAHKSGSGNGSSRELKEKKSESKSEPSPPAGDSKPASAEKK